MKHHTTENQDEVNNSSLYLDETGSNGISLLKRIEKYYHWKRSWKRV